MNEGLRGGGSEDFGTALMFFNDWEGTECSEGLIIHYYVNHLA